MFACPRSPLCCPLRDESGAVRVDLSGAVRVSWPRAGPAMDDLAKLQYLSLVSKVCAELDAHLGVSDKTLAEFIIDLAQKHPELGAFRAALDENGAEFPSSFASSLLALITKMMPKKRSAPAKASSSRAADAGPQERFSGLAVANDSDARRRELELDALGGGAVADPALGFDRRASRDSRGGGGGGNPNPNPSPSPSPSPNPDPNPDSNPDPNPDPDSNQARATWAARRSRDAWRTRTRRPSRG